MRCGNERERTIRQFAIVKNKLTPVLHASALLLIMNFVTTLSWQLWIHEAIRRLLCYDEIHDQ